MEKHRRINISLPKEDLEFIKERSVALGITTSELLRRAARNFNPSGERVLYNQANADKIQRLTNAQNHSHVINMALKSFLSLAERNQRLPEGVDQAPSGEKEVVYD